MQKCIALLLTYFLAASFFAPQPAYAMHIAEGFLPGAWAGFWYAVTLPFLLIGLRSVARSVQDRPNLKMLLGLVGAFAFILSALKIPSITGSCSHPTGVGLGAIIFGPSTMTVLGCIVLIFQALLLAHGGISTLGANTFSMAVAGPFVSYAAYKCCARFFPRQAAVFIAAFLGDLATYTVTSLQLALAFPDSAGGITASFIKFAGVFGITQLPLAVSEGLLTVLVFNILLNYNKDELEELAVIRRTAGSRGA